MNEKLQRLATKMIGLFPNDFKNPQDCYDQFRVVYKTQFDYFQNFEPSNTLKLVFYLYSLKNTGNFKLAENLLNKSGFASLFIMESDYYESECGECNGEGSYRCGFCGRSGTVDCGNCDGDGNIEMEDDNEWVDCDNCDGTGEVTCDECGGSGEETCQTCDGDGQIETDEHEYKYYVIVTWNNFIKDRCELESGTITPAFTEYDFDRLSDEYIVLGYDEEHAEFYSAVLPDDVYCANYEDEPELHKSYSREFRIWMDNDGLDKYKL